MHPLHSAPLLAVLVTALSGTSHLAAQESAPPDEASVLFSSSGIQDFHLTVAPADWQTLKDNYLANDYYEADFRWGDYSLARIGIRSRGSASRSGVKPSLKLDFNKYGAGTLFGLKSLVVKNLTQDVPMVREYLSMALSAHLGFFTPRETFVRLFVNGEYQGLFLAIEPLDKIFLTRAFGSGNGDLFSIEWTFPYRFEYLGPDPAAYSPSPFKPETNEKQPNLAPIIEIAELAQNLPAEEFATAISQRVNLDQILGHLALDAYVANKDGFAGGIGMNNVYLHRPAETAETPQPLITALPWDKDSAFNWYDMPIHFDFSSNVLLRRFMEDPVIASRFLHWVEAVATASGGEDGWLAYTFENTAALIREAAESDPNKPFSNGEFDHALEETRAFIRQRQIHVRAQLEEWRPTPAPPEQTVARIKP
ncbi:MAG: CotH kinase family protein [Acidobacteria bacterium]|nr:CotH kinase family protein [Acidobacteriota bacterium]